MNKLKLLLVFLCFTSLLKAQDLPELGKQEIIEQRVDFLLDANESGDNDYTSLFEQLEFFYEKPLNLNSASRTDLIDLGLLSEIQINNLFNHIQKNGKLIAFEELQTIDGFDIEIIRQIQPFVKVSSDIDRLRISPKNLLKEGNAALFLRYSRILESQEGFTAIEAQELEENPNARYLGSPDKVFTRFRFNYSNQLSFGFTGEKDAGEEFLQGTQKNGFDFYSAHFFMQGFGRVKQLAIGDYQAQFGQGLTFWSGLAFGRSPNVFTIKRNAPGLRQYTSVQEDLFLRGGGVTLNYGKFDLTLFHSSTKVDANIIGTDTINNEVIISSLGESGFHRTPNELDKKNQVRNEYTGAHLRFTQRNFNMGITAVHNEIGGQFTPQKRIYNQFQNLDNKNSNIGLDYSYLFNNVNLFGELAKSIDGGIAYTNGALIVLDPSLSLSLQHRRFERDFKAIQSNALGENSTNSNEEGTFLGINMKASKELTISAFVDRFEFDWLRFQTDAPSNGKRYLLELNYSPHKRLTSYFRYRLRSRGRNNSESPQGIDQIVQEDLKNYRLHLDYKVSKSITLKSRIEFSNYKLGSNSTEEGILVYQDINYKQLSFPLSFSLRYAIFETESYNSRIYAYENDVLYAFSVPAYNGRGSRFYITTKYHVSRNIDLWLRYAQTFYSDRNEIGSGKDAIDGNTRSEVKAQLRIKF